MSGDKISDKIDRDAIAHVVHMIRSDWDRQGIKSALAKHPDQTVALLAAQAIIAACTRLDQKTPAVVGLDGDHTDRARAALSQPARAKGPAYTDRGRPCACGVYEDAHHGAAVLDGHEYTPAPEYVPASPDAATNAKNRWLASRDRSTSTVTTGAGSDADIGG